MRAGLEERKRGKKKRGKSKKRNGDEKQVVREEVREKEGSKGKVNKREKERYGGR